MKGVNLIKRKEAVLNKNKEVLRVKTVNSEDIKIVRKMTTVVDLYIHKCICNIIF